MESKVLAIVSDVLGKEATMDMKFEGVASLKILQIIMALDEEDIEVPLEHVAKIKSVADILKFAKEA